MRARTVAQVIAGEAVHGTLEERQADMRAIASVIANRSRMLGVTPEEVVQNRREFNAYNKPLPAGASAYVALAEEALGYVDANGPVHNATFYATPAATRNLPRGLQAIAETTGHRYFSDPQNRAIRTAVGFRQPNTTPVSLPVTGPVPTSAPRGLLGPAPQTGGLLGKEAPADFKMTIKPILGQVALSSPFGMRTHPVLGDRRLHTGMDFASTPKQRIDGQPAYSVAPGTVVSSRRSSSYGNRVEIDHGNGYRTTYSHLDSRDVKVGDTVRSGQPLGKIGTTGRSTGPHLHFEVSRNGEYVDPASFVAAAGTPAKVVTPAAAVARDAINPSRASFPADAEVTRGLLDAPKVAPTVGLLGTAAPRGLLDGTTKPVPVQTASRSAAVRNTPTSARITNTATPAPISNNPTRLVGTDITGGLAEKGRRVTSPEATLQARALDAQQAANLASRLDAFEMRTAAAAPTAPRTTAARPTAATVAATVANPAVAARVTPAARTLSPVQNATRSLATTTSSAARVVNSAAPAKVTNGATPAKVVSSRFVGTEGLSPAAVEARAAAAATPKTWQAPSAYNQTPAFSTTVPKIDAISQPPIPGLQRVAPTAAPPLGAPVAVPARVVASVPAARAETPMTAAPRTAPRTMKLGLNSLNAPPAPASTARRYEPGMVSRVENVAGTVAGGLLGSTVAGPIGGLLGGMVGRSLANGAMGEKLGGLLSQHDPYTPSTGFFDAGRGLNAINAVRSGAAGPGAVARSISNPSLSVSMGANGQTRMTSDRYGWTETYGSNGNIVGIDYGPSAPSQAPASMGLLGRATNAIGGLLGVGRTTSSDPRMSGAAGFASALGFDGMSHPGGGFGQLGRSLGRALGVQSMPEPMRPAAPPGSVTTGGLAGLLGESFGGGLLGGSSSSSSRPSSGLGGLLGGLFGGGGSSSGGIGPNGTGPRNTSGGSENRNTSSTSSGSRSSGRRK